jgi:hypothetical protein
MVKTFLVGQRPVEAVPRAAGRAVMIGILLLGAAVMWHDLGTRDVLGRDENATVIKLDQPDLRAVLHVTGLKFTGEPGNMQPLYFLVHHLFWPIVQRSAFVLRFVPSAFALLAIAITYKLGEALLGREAAVVGALFTAILPLQVRYAQIARPYTLLALLALTSAFFLVRGLATNRLVHWSGFFLTAALCFYTHYNALFVLLAEGLFTSVIWLSMLTDVLRKRRPAVRLVGPVLAFLMVGLLCLPGLVRLLRLPWVGPEGAAEPSAAVAVELSLSFFAGFLSRVGLVIPWQQVFILALVCLGLATALYQRRWQAALFAALWLSVPFLVLSVIKSPRPFEERYVIFVPPVALLLVGQTIVVVGHAVASLGRRIGVSASDRSRWIVIAAASLGLALIFVAPLRAYYDANDSEARLEYTLTVVEHQARPGDVVVISPRTFVRPLSVDGAQVLYLTEHLSPADLDHLAMQYQRMWLLYSSFLPTIALQEPLDEWVQAHQDQFVLLPIKAPSVVAYGNVAALDAEDRLKDRITALDELVQGPAGQHGKWVRYGILADAYQALGDLYADQGNDALATEYWSKAEETRAAAPPPW